MPTSCQQQNLCNRSYCKPMFVPKNSTNVMLPICCISAIMLFWHFLLSDPLSSFLVFSALKVAHLHARACLSYGLYLALFHPFDPKLPINMLIQLCSITTSFFCWFDKTQDFLGFIAGCNEGSIVKNFKTF